jgi:hypothetical protein
MRRIVTAITAATLALGLVAQSVPAAAVTGFDSAYAGESAFLTLNPGQSGTFTVFFANTGATTWTKGTSTQVDLAACLEDKVTCDQQDAREAPFNSGWLSATRYATSTQTSVAPGQIGTFTYNVLVPTGASGLYRFNGALRLASTAEDIHNEGYFQDVNVPGAVPPPAGAITVSPSTAATNIVSTALGTTNGQRGIRTYTVTLGSGVTGPVRIALFQSENVIVNSDGTLSFVDADANNKADAGGNTRWLQGTGTTAGASTTSLLAYIQEINGVATGGTPPSGSTTGGTANFEANTQTGTNTIVFTVNSQEMDQVIPVVWKDTSGDGQLDVKTDPCCGAAADNLAARQANGVGNPTESVAIGGQKNWTPEVAAFSTYSCTTASAGDGRAVFVDKTLDYVVIRHNGILRRFNWDANDQFFYVNTATPAAQGPGLTAAQFESFLTPTGQTSSSVSTAAVGEDRLTVAYNPDTAAASQFTDCADRPTRPASITAAVTDAPDSIPATQNECTATPCVIGADSTDSDSDDVQVTFPLSSNPCVVSYSVFRQTTTDNGIVFTTTETVTVNARIKNTGDTTITVYDLNVPVGTHRWRVKANANDPSTTSGTEPECGVNADDSSLRSGSLLTISTQPGGGGPVTGRPISLDARMSTNAGLSQTLDASDAFKVAFNETMDTTSSTTRTIWVRDADGTVGRITCDPVTPPGQPTSQAGQFISASCTWNTAAAETVGGTSYPASSVLTVLIVDTGTPSATTGAPVGTSPGVQIPATIFDASGIVDTTSDTWNIPGSPDVVIDNE